MNLESLGLFTAIDPLEYGSTVPLIENEKLDQFDISSFVTYYSNEDDGDKWDINRNAIKMSFKIVATVY